MKEKDKRAGKKDSGVRGRESAIAGGSLNEDTPPG